MNYTYIQEGSFCKVEYITLIIANNIANLYLFSFVLQKMYRGLQEMSINFWNISISFSSNCADLIILTRLKLWVTAARHNF